MTNEVPVTSRALRFGLQPPEGAVRAWGARAIYTVRPEPYIDLLWDRQDSRPYIDEETDLDAAAAFGGKHGWVNTVGLPWLREHVKRTWLSTNARERVAFIDGRYAIAANPNGSFGYLYIVAYDMGDNGGMPPETPTPTHEPRPHSEEVPADG